MSKRSLLISSMCLVASCSLYEELQMPTYDLLQPGQREEPSSGTVPDSQPDGPSLRPDAGAVHSDAADGGAADAASGSAPDASENRAGRAAPAAAGGGGGAAGSGGAGAGEGAAGSGGAASEPVESAAGASAAGASAAGSPAAGSGGAGAAGSTTDPECIEDGGQTWAGNGHCYIPLLTQTSWNVSRDQCAHADAKLAAITSVEELDFVAGLLGDGPAWIGLSKFGAPQFSWSTGEANGFTNWAAGEPNLSGEAAVAMQQDTGKWFDDAVSANYRAICERP